MKRMPKVGESYFYIDNDKVVSRRNTLQDVDIKNAMSLNYYFSEARARYALVSRRLRRKDVKK